RRPRVATCRRSAASAGGRGPAAAPGPTTPVQASAAGETPVPAPWGTCAGRTWPEECPSPRMPLSSRPRLPPVSPPPSAVPFLVVLLRRDRRQIDAQDRGGFFLDLDEELGTLEPTPQFGVLPPQPRSIDLSRRLALASALAAQGL